MKTQMKIQTMIMKIEIVIIGTKEISKYLLNKIPEVDSLQNDKYIYQIRYMK